MNSSHVKVLLPMDHRFIARIRATNLAGESPYVYLVLGDGATVATTMNTTYNINGDTTKDYTSDVSVGAYTLQTTAFPKAYTDDDPTKAVLATPQVLNLFKIEYHPLGGKFSTISSTGSGVNVDSSIALKKYATQYTDLTDPANPAASTVRVEILCPDSKAKHASATPPITAQVLGKKNSKDSMGLDNASELELMTDAGYFWKQWTVGAENGDPYSATGTVNANTSIVPPDMYTGYKSLDLFAVYMTEKDLTPDVIIQNLRDYELKKEFVTLALFTEKGGTATTAKYKINGTSATDITMFPNPLLIKLDPSENTWKVGDLQVKLSNTKYTPVGTGGSDVDINYDKSEVMMTRLRDGMVVAKQTNNVATDAFDIELKGYETGKYIMSIRAYKDTYQYQLQWVFDMVSD